MQLKQAISSSLQLFAVFAYLFAGLFLFALPFLPEAKVKLAQLILEQDDACIQAGIVFSSLSFLFFIGFYGVNRGKELTLKMGTHPVSVHGDIIEEILAERLKKHAVILHAVEIINGKRLEISVSLGAVKQEMQEDLLKEVETSLECLLRDRFGYFKPFHLNVKI